MSSFKTKSISKKKISHSDIVPEFTEKSSPYKVFVGTFLVCLTLLFVWNFVVSLVFWKNLKNKQPGTSVAQSITTQISNIFSSTNTGSETVNILLMWVGWSSHDGGDLTDTLMLASVDKTKWKVVLLSIPRDLYVAKGKQSGSRINELLRDGTAQWVWDALLRKKVEEMTGMPIAYSVMIDFKWFKEAVDVLGGVEIDVPEKLVDTEFPDNNWWYQTLIIEKWLQTFDGETALNYARSRHSTSDFSRSARQQLLIKAIKSKVLSSGIYSPSQILDLYSTVQANLVTDIPVTEIVSLAMSIKDVSNDDILMFNLNNNCLSLQSCEAGAFLYNPSRELFGGASVLIPENASISKLSYYTDIIRFSNIIFHYPEVQKEDARISIVSPAPKKSTANTLAISLKKLWFPLIDKNTIITTTGSIETSHINIYWNEEFKIGYAPDSAVVLALKSIFPDITFTEVKRNEYVTDKWPQIEIVLGSDIHKHTDLITTPYYLPTPPSQTGSQENATGTKKNPVSTQSGWIWDWIITKKESPQWTGADTQKKEETGADVAPGEWENFDHTTPSSTNESPETTSQSWSL